MGTDLTTWNEIVETGGAMYSGLGAEGFWLFVSIALCVVALYIGGKHEADRYKRVEEGKTTTLP
ncbi:MAG: hypothetical protein RIC16_14065 [Rhodospirillales bacterium]